MRVSLKPGHIILLFALIQVLSTTYFLRIDGFHAVNSFVFLLSGLGISYFLLKVPHVKIEKYRAGKQFWIKLAIVLALLPLSYYLSRKIMDGTPLQKEYADMLPVMKVMCQRFVDGDWNNVYDPIPEIWDGIQPIYLPAFWTPFTPAVLFDFDMRWITVAGIWLSVLLCIWIAAWKKNIYSFIYALAILMLLVWLHVDKVNNVIRLTEEGVVFFYYSLVVVAILSGRGWLTGIAVALCLLSRYALIGWIPFAGLFLLLSCQFRFFAEGFISGVAVLLLLMIPFGIKPLLVHLQLHSDYIAHAARVWNENPEFFYQSPGMAKFFGPSRVYLQHTILLAGSFIIPLFFLFLLKKRSVPFNIVLLSCFQFCLTFFYSFLDVSYLYLYYTPVFVSLVIAGWSLYSKDYSR